MNNSKINHTSSSIRGGYEQYNVQGFYERFGDEYRNPHEPAIEQILHVAVIKWQLELGKVLDLACGSGEVTVVLKGLGCLNIDGIDPYTYNAYFKRTGQQAEPYSFEEIASGALCGRNYSLIVCSFALHLLAESRLPMLLYQLSLIAKSMVILTPHKRPVLKPEWGWSCLDEIIVERVRSRFYQTNDTMNLLSNTPTLSP